jgi:hypothetical protein
MRSLGEAVATWAIASVSLSILASRDLHEDKIREELLIDFRQGWHEPNGPQTLNRDPMLSELSKYLAGCSQPPQTRSIMPRTDSSAVNVSVDQQVKFGLGIKQVV